MDFSCEQVVRLYDTDEAGFVFFGSYLRFAQAALEEFLAHVGLPVAQILSRRATLYPVVHAEVDCRAPLKAGDRFAVQVSVLALGERSFTLGYRLVLADGREAGSARTVHAALDPATGASCPLSEEVRTLLGDRP